MKQILTIISLAALIAGATATAQPGGRGGLGNPSGISASIAKIFGDNRAFTAKMETTMQDPAQSEPITTEVKMAMLDGKIWVETDVTKVKGAGIPQERIAQMKQIGMEIRVNIIRPDQKITYNVFPHVQAYIGTAMTDKQVADAMDKSKLEKTSLGKETIDGHPCEKNKVVIKGDKGEEHELLIWNATDLKNFPIQIAMEEQGNKIVLKYKDVKLEKPDSKTFELPANFTKYDNIQKMMMAEGMKRASAGGFGAPGAK
jgi:Domain of unknown function (DUF4412)